MQRDVKLGRNNFERSLDDVRNLTKMTDNNSLYYNLP